MRLILINKLSLNLTLVLVYLLTGNIAVAEDLSEDWFQIEVLVFAHQSPQLDNELWPEQLLQYPADILAIAPSSSKELRPKTLWQLYDDLEYQNLHLTYNKKKKPSPSEGLWLQLLAAFSGEDLNIPEALINLSVDSRNLNAAERRLERSPQYRVLHHISWRQPLLKNESKTTVLIQAGQQYENFFELDGTLSFRRSRYVHVNADLWFTEFAHYEDADEQREIRESTIAEDKELTRLLSSHPDIRQLELRRNQFVPHQTYRLAESRRLKNEQTNYLDHPAFGVLIRVNSYDPLFAEEEESE